MELCEALELREPLDALDTLLSCEADLDRREPALEPGELLRLRWLSSSVLLSPSAWGLLGELTEIIIYKALLSTVYIANSPTTASIAA